MRNRTAGTNRISSSILQAYLGDVELLSDSTMNQESRNEHVCQLLNYTIG